MQWSYVTFESEEYQGITPSIETNTYKYFGDIVVNRLTYKKLSKSSDNGTTWTKIGLIREQDKQVFKHSAEGKGSETMIIKFDTEENGDYTFGLNKTSTEPTIDTIVLAGTKKVRFGLVRNGFNEGIPAMLGNEWYSFYDCVVEDIGDLYYPVFDSSVPCGFNMDGALYYTYLLCVKKGDDIIYHNTKYDECYYHREHVAIDDISTNKCIVSPNPVYNTINLNLPYGENEYEIVNINGIVFLKGRTTDNQIDVSELPNGVYFLKVQGKTIKFIKQ